MALVPWGALRHYLDSHAPLPTLQSAAADRIDWVRALPFLALHVACLGVFWVGTSWAAVGLAGALFVVRMFFVTAFFHRYFSHRAFRTSRVFQFLMAVAVCTTGQRGPLWWAAHHRHHHANSDEAADVHSPGQRGFWWAHAGWFLTPRNTAAPLRMVPDLAKVPELRWIDRFAWLPFVTLGVVIGVWGGWQMLVWGFVISTVALYHATYTINSLAHVWGRVRYATRDGSRNNFILALLTLGEGWHNNHHYYPAAARQGFRWWEIDICYYGLRVLAALRLIWDLRPVPARVLAAASRP